MTAGTGCLLSYRSGEVAVVALNRPAALNALDTPLLARLGAAITECGADAGAVVLAAEGRHFCAGADLAEVASAVGDREAITSFLTLFQRTADAIATAPVPVIAAVQGWALAGGLELALACDVIVAADSAEFGDQHINVDLVPGGGGSQRLPRAIGARRALALQLTGERIDSGRAVAWGLVHSVHPAASLRGEAIRLAAAIAARDRDAVRRIRELNRVALAHPLGEGLPIELAAAADQLARPALPAGLRRFRKPAEPGPAGSPQRPGNAQ